MGPSPPLRLSNQPSLESVHNVKSANPCVLCGADCPISIVTQDRNRAVSQTQFQYRRCERCELLFLSNPPCNLAEHYPPGYVTPPGSLATLQRVAELNRYQLDLLLRFVRPGRLLEIGPGYGSFLWLAKRAGFTVTAIEPDGTACEYLEQTVRTNVIKSAAPEQVLASTADEYGAIVLWHALEHLPHPWQTLREAAQRLNAGGVIAIATPNPRAWQFRRLGRYWPHIDAPRHLWLIPLEVLRGFLEPLGLTLVFATSDDPAGRSWNRFGWSQALLNLQPRFLKKTFVAKVVTRVLGHVVGFSVRPWERAELRGSAYTAVFQKRSLS